MKCWGDGSLGQLGNGTIISSFTPITVPGITNTVAISGGRTHTCAVLTDGSAKCWGDGTHGQLGNNTGKVMPPRNVDNLASVAAVFAGDFVTCAVLTDGSAKCWGDNSHGQLGFDDGTTTLSTAVTVPVAVTGL